MKPQVFLSLSHVDADLVDTVFSRLPIGLALFYKKSFENAEDMLAAMDRTTERAQVFAFFVSKESLASKACQFELDRARHAEVFKDNVRILVFPTDPSVSFRDLPSWVQDRWIGSAGYNANDIARYITAVILEPNHGISPQAVQVVGRGRALDKLDALSADFLQTHGQTPRVYILPGVGGIGRRTFASYYARTSLGSMAALPYGPTLNLPDQAELEDVYRAVRQEVEPVKTAELQRDISHFRSLNLNDRVQEVSRLLQHYENLGQAVRIASASGFFEESGHPKEWVLPLLQNLPETLILFLISNRQFKHDFIEQSACAVQMRVEELSDRDTNTLMIHTAQRLGVENFSITNTLLAAIGGYPDVANAAVRIANQRGLDSLSRDPAYLFNVQKTILGEAISDQNLSSSERLILDALSWVPEMGGDILLEIFSKENAGSEVEFVGTCQALVDTCMIIPRGYAFQISPSIRQLYRRWNSAPQGRLKIIADVLAEKWNESQRNGTFREDLFDAFVFMNALTGGDLPTELKGLLSPGTLASVVRETYAKGKADDDVAALEKVAAWGAIAEGMDMSPAVREDILNTAARAYIRAGKEKEGQSIIDKMRELGFASTDFLQGHLFRKARQFDKAISYLEEAVFQTRKFNRSAVHELALSYSRIGEEDKLARLLEKFGDKIQDSSMFLDFEIGRDIASGNFTNLGAKIRRLRALPDDEGRADLREAQLMIREGEFRRAKDFLTDCLGTSLARQFHIRTLRCKAAIRDRDFATARRDIEFISALAGRRDVATSLEADLLAHMSRYDDAIAMLKRITRWSPVEWRQYARILEMKADESPSISEKSDLAAEAADIFSRYGTYSAEYPFI